jgi:hypothetical protein
VGELVGKSVGELVGASVGPSVDLMVGPSIGNLVAPSVGALLEGESLFGACDVGPFVGVSAGIGGQIHKLHGGWY